MKTSSYTYQFANGIITISKGINTRFDWFVKVDMTDDVDGSKRGIVLDQRIFLTRRHALATTTELLKKYDLL